MFQIEALAAKILTAFGPNLYIIKAFVENLI